MPLTLTPELRTKMIAIADEHARKDAYAHGRYQPISGQPGCSIGCTIMDAMELGLLPRNTNYGSHSDVAMLYGLPPQIPHVIDRLFEGLPRELSQQWTPRWMRACRDGADYSLVWARFALWLLRDLPRGEHSNAAVDSVIGLYERWLAGNKPSDAEFHDAARVFARVFASSSAAAAAAAVAAAVAVAATDNARAAASATTFVYAVGYISMSNKLIELLTQTEPNHDTD